MGGETSRLSRNYHQDVKKKCTNVSKTLFDFYSEPSNYYKRQFIDDVESARDSIYTFLKLDDLDPNISNNLRSVLTIFSRDLEPIRN